MRKHVAMALFCVSLFLGSIPHAMATKLIPFVTDATFPEKILNTKGFKIISAWAIWCPSCNEALPHMQTFYETHHDKVDVFLLDFDVRQQLHKVLNVNSVPRYILFLDGVAVGRKRTIKSEQDVIDWVNFYAVKLTGAPHFPDLVSNTAFIEDAEEDQDSAK